MSAYVATGSLRAGLWGAFSGAIFFGIGSYFQSAQWAHDTGLACSQGLTSGAQVASVAAHAAAGGIVQDLEGGNFGSGFLVAGATTALSPAVENIDSAPERIMIATVVGGTVSKISGDKFANGATTAFFQELFNSTIHATTRRQATAAEKQRYERAVALAADANKGLSMFRFGSENDAADWFSAIANPITAATGYEVGADIIKDDYGYYLYSLHVNPVLGGGAVNIEAPGSDAVGTYVAYDHTHPFESGFSDNGSFWNKQTHYQGNWGDLNTAIDQGVDAYVSLPSGSQLRFDYGVFVQAQSSGQWTIYARDFVNPIK